MDDKKRRELIDRYKDGYRIVADALVGATDEELAAHPAPGKWSAREIVHHLADSEMTAAVRLRLLLAEDRAQIRGYDQERFAKVLFYSRPYQASLEAFRYARETTGEILDLLSADQWKRQGTHSEIGAYSVERWLEIYADHAHKHAEQIKRARSSAKR